MSTAEPDRSPLDPADAGGRVMAPHIRRGLAGGWVFLSGCACVGLLYTPSGVDSMWTGLAVLTLGLLQARFLHHAEQAAQRQLQAQEQQARRNAAEEIRRAQHDFLSVMSHEIRTPLNGIVGLATLMQDERMDAASRQQHLRMLSQSSQALASLVSDVLEDSRIEAHCIEARHEPFSLVAWAKDLDHTFCAAAAVKGLFLQVDLDASAGDWVRGDAARLRQIAAHYLSNAIKFTKAGAVRIHISRPRGNDVLRFEVHDNGIGLSETAQQQLFRLFKPGDARAYQEFGGTGLGLSLCERLARRMEGTVGVSSRPGLGSTFWAEVRVPLQVNHSQPAEAEAPEGLGAGRLGSFDLDAARVLVVDDNAINRTSTSQMLRRMNAIVTTANDGAEALEVLRTAQSEGWPFELVLMDVQMPGMDGLTAVGLIRQDPRLAPTPVVALTAGVLKEDVSRAIEAGMDGFLAKPVTAEQLARNVAHFAAAGRQRRRHDSLLRF